MMEKGKKAKYKAKTCDEVFFINVINISPLILSNEESRLYF